MTFAVPASVPEADDAIVIPNLPFFPEIKVGDIRAMIRIDGTVEPKRFRAELLSAMFQTNHELAQWRQQKEAEGYATLAAVPAEILGTEHRLVSLYRRAIACAIKAALLERYRDTDIGRDSKESHLTEQIDEYRRDTRWALRDLMGIKRATVDVL